MVRLVAQKGDDGKEEKAIGMKLSCLFVRYSNRYQPVAKNRRLKEAF